MRKETERHREDRRVMIKQRADGGRGGKMGVRKDRREQEGGGGSRELGKVGCVERERQRERKKRQTDE